MPSPTACLAKTKSKFSGSSKIFSDPRKIFSCLRKIIFLVRGKISEVDSSLKTLFNMKRFDFFNLDSSFSAPKACESPPIRLTS